jgi:transcriptional regulator with XRE-family HTH domain
MTEAVWWRYVMTVTGNAPQKDIASATGIDQSSISRWQRGNTTPRAEAVVALARAYGRSPVEALVAAGYLSSSELGVVELTTLTG